MLLSPSSLQIADLGVFSVIRCDECQGPVPMLYKDIAGQGHLETGSYVDCDQQWTDPVAVAIDPSSTLSEVQDCLSRDPKHLPVIGRIDDGKTAILRHSETSASFPFERVTLTFRPDRKVYSFSLNVWLNIRALINRPIHLHLARLASKWVASLTDFGVRLKTNVLLMFSYACTPRAELTSPLSFITERLTVAGMKNSATVIGAIIRKFRLIYCSFAICSSKQIYNQSENRDGGHTFLGQHSEYNSSEQCVLQFATDSICNTRYSSRLDIKNLSRRLAEAFTKIFVSRKTSKKDSHQDSILQSILAQKIKIYLDDWFYWKNQKAVGGV